VRVILLLSQREASGMGDAAVTLLSQLLGLVAEDQSAVVFLARDV
jgi:hypothetical protein